MRTRTAGNSKEKLKVLDRVIYVEINFVNYPQFKKRLKCLDKKLVSPDGRKRVSIKLSLATNKQTNMYSIKQTNKSYQIQNFAS